MSTQALARKWRPHSFHEMVGQESTLQMLTNALLQKRIHHAYLFTGTRGVGKTTLARILAKCLNCETGITATPCGQCSPCQAIDAGQFIDLYEVDAASRTKVEDTRELLENVLYSPVQGRYKIYLIDEVHMLSHHSFNALLKTLEEPPEHVKFLLATTEPKRLPITILSRCLQFHLKRIMPAQIIAYLQQLCDREKINCATAALAKLAKAADGSMRDALSLLDQAIAFGNGQVQLAEVDAMLGHIPEGEIFPLLQSLVAQDGEQLFTTLSHLAQLAPDFNQLLETLINIFHQLAVAKVVPNMTIEPNLRELLECFTGEEIQLYYQIALLGRRDLAYTPTPQQGFEMTMLRMLAFKPNLSLNAPTVSSLSSLSSLPLSEKVSDAPTIATQELQNQNNQTHIATALKTVPASATEKTQQRLAWNDILPKLELSGMSYALAANCSLKSHEHGKIILALSASHEPMLNQKLKERLAQALERYYGQPMQLEIHITSLPLLTPLKQEQHAEEKRLQAAKQQVMENSQIKKLIAMYDATIDISL